MGSIMTRKATRSSRRFVATALVGLLVIADPLLVASHAYPDEPPPPAPDEHYRNPPPPPPPPVVVPQPPRPLSDEAKVVYFPFYVTGLILRYGLYYLFVAPFEVFGRALSYGVS